jgi:TetR/AcrR family transcriptional repressor of nem operon
MRDRGELADNADPRHLAVALLAAHQGGTLLTFVTGSAEPFRAAVNAALAYVDSFRPTPKKR